MSADAFQEFPIDTSGQDEPEGIAVGPDSNLRFTLTGINKIGVMDPTTGAMVAEVAVPTASAGLTQIVSNPTDANLWFTEGAADKVGTIDPTTEAVAEFAVPSAGAAPNTIAVDKGGNVWFIESNVTRGKIE